jgi:hypothetical protein
MKPFNLEEAKAGKPVCLADGTPVRIICFDRAHDEYPIVALLHYQDGGEDLGWYSLKGVYENRVGSNYNLYMKTENKTGYVIIRKNDRAVKCSGTIFHNIYDAARLADPAKEVIAQIEWEE